MRAIRRGDVVYDIADQRHHGIVETLHLVRGRNDKRCRFYANVKWLETEWRSYRIPVANLRRVPTEPADRTECSIMQAQLNQRSKP